ncbi:MAG TPA: ABC transporter substrate-binding protein [Vicinamibacteria bacterium]|nr:ABC transporter substrate-binding protein [Vicinamibacteria bacterium]
MKRPGNKSPGLVAAALLLFGVLPAASAETRIGVLLWNPQLRYEQCKDGAIEQLRQEGFKEPEVTFVIEQANGNKTTVIELARKFHAAHMNLVIPVGTSAAVAVAAEIKDAPVVFAFVFDPVDSKIAQDWKSSGNNTTGSSSQTSAPTLLSSLKQLAPVKTLAVLYTPGEKNTEAQLKDVEALQGDSQVKVLPVALKSRADVVPEVSVLQGKAEAVLLTGSSIIGDMAAQIVVLANKAKLITATQSEDHLDKGVLLGVTVDPIAVGRLAGKKAAMVLRGAKPASIPIEALKTSDVIVNLKTAKAIGLPVPAAFRRAATRILE